MRWDNEWAFPLPQSLLLDMCFPMKSEKRKWHCVFAERANNRLVVDFDDIFLITRPDAKSPKRGKSKTRNWKFSEAHISIVATEEDTSKYDSSWWLHSKNHRKWTFYCIFSFGLTFLPWRFLTAEFFFGYGISTLLLIVVKYAPNI